MDKLIKIIDIISIIIIAAYICYIFASHNKSDIDYSYSAYAAVHGDTVSHIQEKLSESIETVLNPKQYLVVKNSDGYDVTLYDKDNEKVYSMRYYKEPWIKEISEDILEIGITIGSSDSYVFYFNKADSRVSPTYLNPMIIGNKYVAYMETDDELIFSDIFDEKILCERIVRDFAKTDNLMSAIIDIEMEDDETAVLKYYEDGRSIKKIEDLLIRLPLENNKIWIDTVIIDNKEYQISLEQISGTRNGEMFSYADYCMSISDGSGNTVHEITVNDLITALEEVYWLKDINNDGSTDIILCTWYSEGLHLDSYSYLYFYVWNKAEGRYELQNIPAHNMRYPIWIEELGVVLIYVDGNEKMYIMKGNEWELYAELLREKNDASSDAENNKTMLKEIFYENGEVIQSNVIDFDTFWQDETYIWNRYDDVGFRLYPLRWKKVRTLQGRLKYVRNQEEQ